MSTPDLQHEMLIANAGSGKTHRLTVRMITLLGIGVDPAKIAALTFTRKAAGEFLESVFRRLALAAIDPGELGKLQKETDIPGAIRDATHCRSILAELIRNLNRLSMGTIDSLFGRIVHSFPLETGLSGDFSILSDTAQTYFRRNVLATLFRENADTGFQEFLEVVLQQSRKNGERRVFETLLESAKSLHGIFLRTPVGTAWGQREIIWPDGCSILEAGDVNGAANAFWEAIQATHPDMAEDALEKWKTELDQVRRARPGQPWPKDLGAFITGKLLKHSTGKDGSEYVPMGGGKACRLNLNDQVTATRRALAHALLKSEFESLLRRSSALHRVMREFESIYARSVRSQGLLTFGDVTDLLASQVNEPEWRAAVAYRLDARFDHWLLDEFQDTSHPQWTVLEALIDEVVQYPESGRSFFYVGDTKQAIYSWRGGDPELFFKIREKYNQGTDNPIRKAAPLATSYRSDPEIIDLVNEVFGDMQPVQEELNLPDQTVNDWSNAWVVHKVAPQNRSNEGYACWLPVDKADSVDEDDDASPQDREILRILEEVRPWERGWSCAALKRDNKKVARLAALLQSRGIPVAVEGKANPCTDNPLGAALILAFQFVSSPQDEWSGAVLKASPMGGALIDDDPFAFRERALRTISESGFAGTVRSWLNAVDLSAEPFLEARAVEFLSAAGEFDMSRQPADGIGEFLHHIEHYQRQEAEGSGVIRVMTIHQAKGLTFDMAIVSELGAIVRDRTSGEMALGKNRHNQDWGLLMPKSDIAQSEETLSQARMRMLAESAYGELCSAYVATTRPRHGLYVLTEKLTATSTSKSFARLLALKLDVPEQMYERGNPLWYSAGQTADAPRAHAAMARIELPPPTTGTPRAIPPSSMHAKPDRVPGTNVAPGIPVSPDSGALGSEVHACLSGIEWKLSPKAADSRLSPEAKSLLTPFLKGAAAKRIFAKPESPCLLWRERAFDLLLNGQWISGIFDRVHVALDESGKPASATVYDFKTDDASSAQLEKRYAAQMSAYREAAAVLLGVDADLIATEIVEVRHAR